MQSTPARLSLSSRRAQISIQQPPPQFSIQRGESGLRLQSSGPRIEIDSTAARESYGYYTPSAFMRELVAYSLRQAGRGIGDIAAAGDQMARTPHNGQAIPALAFERQFVNARDRQFVIAMVPKVPPSIRITPGSLSISAAYSPPRIQIISDPPMISSEPAQLDISATPSSLSISLRNGGIDTLA
jgi:hypothetical protein